MPKKVAKRLRPRFWVSWVQPTADFRPMHDPPANKSVLAWWCSGFDSSCNAVLCALVNAKDEYEVSNCLRKDWPEVVDVQWRFIKKQPAGWVPESGRFPIRAQWEKERCGLARFQP